MDGRDRGRNNQQIPFGLYKPCSVRNPWKPEWRDRGLGNQQKELAAVQALQHQEHVETRMEYKPRSIGNPWKPEWRNRGRGNQQELAARQTLQRQVPVETRMEYEPCSVTNSWKPEWRGRGRGNQQKELAVVQTLQHQEPRMEYKPCSFRNPEWRDRGYQQKELAAVQVLQRQEPVETRMEIREGDRKPIEIVDRKDDNVDFLKLNIPTNHSDEILAAAESLLCESSDLDEMNRKDLTDLKVYAIDVDEAAELDDALSATRLQDGRIRVWIHVADPTRYVEPGSIIDREAMRRATSVFLPTATYPMFPEKLAMEGMNFQQGQLCNAVSVSVILHSDGSIAEYSVQNSIIKPTYMLTYESATELLNRPEEEPELKILSEAAALRLKWRRQQGAIETPTLDPRITVVNPEDPEPTFNLYVENQANPAKRLVTEMMILCGQVIATFGSSNNLALPYRGQPQSNIDISAFSYLPEGPVRSSAIVKTMRAAKIDFRKPIRHASLGLSGYVQFTSPIRRYLDLLAHYQVKAFLRGESPPFSAGQLEQMASGVNMQVRVVRNLCSSSLQYWIIEFLRRQPKEKKFRALILRFIKYGVADLLLLEVGFQASASVSVGTKIGDEIEVKVEEAHPRDGFLKLKEVIRN
ncbi:Ribonuclease II/R [Corchorus olitorius]|uniref:Ribonuclease II/R n=1 Tax=Corchorus olitorius TaxID=93759 RepID=A0A1R3J9R5_9ROSI|nr:Ribonuclease II/R [Corchorus olitorius]